MRKKKTNRQQELAASVRNLLTTFRNTYEARQHGRSLTEILINFDIVAAGTPELQEGAVKGHRRIAESASDAFDKQIPLRMATDAMSLELHTIACEVLLHEQRKGRN